jgi:hypothetical protein
MLLGEALRSFQSGACPGEGPPSGPTFGWYKFLLNSQRSGNWIGRSTGITIFLTGLTTVDLLVTKQNLPPHFKLSSIASGSYLSCKKSFYYWSSSTNSSWLPCGSRSEQFVSNSRPRRKGTPARFRLLVMDTPAMNPIPACNQGWADCHI